MKIIRLVVDFHPLNGYYSAMYKRNITHQVQQALSDTPILLLNGARQTGKSTLAQSLVEDGKHAQYYSFDDPSLLSVARADPASFIQRLTGNVILDEMQRVPELFLPIKMAVDKNRQPGRFLLTGSANVLLLPQLADSLAGRMEILTLWPLSQGEINGVREGFIDALFQKDFSIKLKSKLNSQQWLHKIICGGYPEVLSRKTEERRHAWFSSYIMTILQRDIRDLMQIEKIAELPHLLALLATRAATVLNFAELSRSSAIPQTTLKRYLTLLQMTFLTYLLPAWSTNHSKRLVKSPKIFLNDTGLLCDLLGMNFDYLTTDMNQTGHVLENFIVVELLKQSTWSKIQPKLFHFRSQTGEEVDVVLQDRRGRIIGIEIKSRATINPKDFKGLATLAEIAGNKFLHGILLYTGTESISYGKNMTALPIDALWEVASMEAE